MSRSSPSWTLRPGDTIRRKELHDVYGGSRQSGISPSRKSSNVMVFTDPNSGEQHGYYDRWDEDGTLWYTGEGQRGDQVLTKGNAAIYEHREHGRSLRVFEGAGGHIRYIGEFAVDPLCPVVEKQAHETGGGPLRKVLIFKLVPVESVAMPGADEAHGIVVSLENNEVERTVVQREEGESEAVRRESELVTAFADSLAAQGVAVKRLKCVFAGGGESSALYSDLYLPEVGVLIEAKGSVTRGAVRMAIGQLMDYRRFAPDPVRLAILLPRHPGPDLEALLSSVEVSIVWRVGNELFRDNAGGSLASPHAVA